MKVIDGVRVWSVGEIEDKVLEQAKMAAKDPRCVGVALMADAHLGYSVPVGGVVAYREAVTPNGVGYDIGCGVLAVKTNIVWSDIAHRREQIADDIAKKINFGIGRESGSSDEHPLMSNAAWDLLPAELKSLKRMASGQLGTVGSGNHYVDVLVEGDHALSPVWVATHFGSRGFGHKTATYFLEKAGAGDGMDVPPVVLDTNSYFGQAYLHAMWLAGEYAYAGRDMVVDDVLKILGADWTTFVHNHHNYAFAEPHGGENLWVVRKGATPARPNQTGFVGGSMGDMAAIVEGVESTESPFTYYSTVHGAGRVMSRGQAKGVLGHKRSIVRKTNGELDWRKHPWGKQAPKLATGEHVLNPLFDDDAAKFLAELEKDQGRSLTGEVSVSDWLTATGDVVVRGGGVDEAPQVYRKLQDVLAAQGDTIKVKHILQPKIVVMAGANEYDPYKD